jgi:hypothetical protein
VDSDVRDAVRRRACCIASLSRATEKTATKTVDADEKKRERRCEKTGWPPVSMMVSTTPRDDLSSVALSTICGAIFVGCRALLGVAGSSAAASSSTRSSGGGAETDAMACRHSSSSAAAP